MDLIEFTKSRKRCTTVMRESRDSEGDKSHVVFTIKQPNETNEKNCTYSTFNRPKSVRPRSSANDTLKAPTAPSLQNFDSFITNDYSQNIRNLNAFNTVVVSPKSKKEIKLRRKGSLNINMNSEKSNFIINLNND